MTNERVVFFFFCQVFLAPFYCFSLINKAEPFLVVVVAILLRLFFSLFYAGVLLNNMKLEMRFHTVKSNRCVQLCSSGAPSSLQKNQVI